MSMYLLLDIKYIHDFLNVQNAYSSKNYTLQAAFSSDAASVFSLLGFAIAFVSW